MENIKELRHENKTIFLIANLSFQNNKQLSELELKNSHIKFAECDAYLREIVKKYDLEINYIDLLYATIEHKKFQDFILSTIKKRHIKKI